MELRSICLCSWCVSSCCLSSIIFDILVIPDLNKEKHLQRRKNDLNKKKHQVRRQLRLLSWCWYHCFNHNPPVWGRGVSSDEFTNWVAATLPSRSSLHEWLILHNEAPLNYYKTLASDFLSLIMPQCTHNTIDLLPPIINSLFMVSLYCQKVLILNPSVSVSAEH